jgi:hypothetical protein
MFCNAGQTEKVAPAKVNAIIYVTSSLRATFESEAIAFLFHA